MVAALTGFGAVTSVGHDAAISCASVRAGVQRARGVSHFTVLEGPDNEQVPLVGRPVYPLTEGFAGAGLWVRLATLALQDLSVRAGLAPASDHAFWSRTGVYAVTPNPTDARFAEFAGVAGQMHGAELIDACLRHLQWPVHAIRTLGLSHAGCIAACALGSQWMLQESTLERVIVVAADSFLDPSTLDWLDAEDRLKCDGNPFGLIPGEAGAALLLESRGSAIARGARISAVIDAPIVVKGQPPLVDAEPVPSRPLKEAVARTLELAGLRRFSGDLYIDLNGEPWRAQQFGSARVLLEDTLGDINVNTPCVSLGECGAASGAIQIGLAARAQERRYARGNVALCLSCAEDGHVASVIVRQGG